MQVDSEDVIAFAGKKPPIFGHRLEWFDLFSEVEGLMENPAPEVPDLPMPKVSTGAAGEGTPRENALHEPLRRERRKERRRQDGEEELGGYVEPEL